MVVYRTYSNFKMSTKLNYLKLKKSRRQSLLLKDSQKMDLFFLHIKMRIKDFNKVLE
jgi:hypothetical protein